MGKPNTAMRYDEAKGRYIIDGESESEEEDVMPPPRMIPKEDTKE
jgi:hypothetical protein